MPKIRDSCSHCYYLHAIKLEVSEISNKVFANAIREELPPFELREKEGVKISGGYVSPIYQLPLFTSAGRKNTLAKQTLKRASQDYTTSLCPVTEKLHNETLITHEFIVPSMTKEDIRDVKRAFEKVWENRHSLITRKK